MRQPVRGLDATNKAPAVIAYQRQHCGGGSERSRREPRRALQRSRERTVEWRERLRRWLAR